MDEYFLVLLKPRISISHFDFYQALHIDISIAALNVTKVLRHSALGDPISYNKIICFRVRDGVRRLRFTQTNECVTECGCRKEIHWVVGVFPSIKQPVRISDLYFRFGLTPILTPLCQQQIVHQKGLLLA